MMRSRLLSAGAASCAVAFLVSACSQGPALRGKIRGLGDTVETARKNGAIRCAPRELALARAHLRFAATELDQGFLSEAEAHLAIAEPNARAAFDMSPPDRCTSREYVEIAQEKPKPRPKDRDGDGITDDIDQCPEVPENYNGYQDEDGCPDDPDTDGDGVPDSRDQCLLQPEDKDGYLDDDGCPDPDNDGDGIPDDKDRSKDGKRDCKNEPEDMDGFEDDDGCPDPDNDGDGVADLLDHCPNTPGIPGGDHPGCPKKMTAVVITAKEIRITQQIQFQTASWIILPVSFKILDEVVEVLKDNPKIDIEVQGHTDNVGGGPYNQWLSNKRAESVMQYLVKHGIDAKRLTSHGYGLTRPLVPNDTEAHRQMNRRVQFIRTEAGANTTTPP